MPTKHILSIDVGISNLSFCLLEFDPKLKTDSMMSLTDVVESTAIRRWETISIAQSVPTYTCCCRLKNGSPCLRKPFYMRSNNYWCKIHASKPLLLASAFTKSKLQKLSIPELTKIYKEHTPMLYSTPITKTALVRDILLFVQNKIITPIPKPPAAKTTPMHIIGQLIIEKMNMRFQDVFIDHVVIENQIGPLAAKMKAVQAQLTMYFLMRNCTQNVGKPFTVEGISASNKLKDYECLSDKYKHRKYSGVEICANLVSIYYPEQADVWNNHKKQDDLADGLLQGLWCIRHMF